LVPTKEEQDENNKTISSDMLAGVAMDHGALCQPDCPRTRPGGGQLLVG